MTLNMYLSYSFGTADFDSNTAFVSTQAVLRSMITKPTYFFPLHFAMS